MQAVTLPGQTGQHSWTSLRDTSSRPRLTKRHRPWEGKMKRILCAFIAIVSVAAAAKDKDKVTALPASAGGNLSGKMLAVTRHKKADFTAMTAGKATFALL